MNNPNKLSNCCSEPMVDDTDFCSGCKDHCEEDKTVDWFDGMQINILGDDSHDCHADQDDGCHACDKIERMQQEAMEDKQALIDEKINFDCQQEEGLIG